MSTKLHIVCPHCDSTNNVPSGRLTDKPRCGNCRQLLFNALPVELTGYNFNKHISKSHLPVVVDFWAAWCGPCKIMAPIFEEASKQMEPRVRFAKVNTESEQGLAAQFNIRSIPTTIIFRNGHEIARQPGAMDLSSLIQ